MKGFHEFRAQMRARLDDEIGTIHRDASRRVALVYPSPYHVAMSSLGFQAIYRLMNGVEGWAAERAFLPDDVEAHRRAQLPLVTYEGERHVSGCDLIAFSVAYELELTGLFDCLSLAGLPLFAAERTAKQPLVVCGGPLTFSNPLPLGPFADVVAMGEAEELATSLLEAVDAEPDRQRLLALLATMPGFWVPSIHGESLPPVAKADDSLLPARSQIVTPNTELRSMFLIEPERGCSRGCTYCVMRRSTNGGMRKVSPDVVLDAIPAHVERVGLVGAAVTDHPKIAEIVRRLVDGGRHIGISSLRADRLTDELVGLLARGGYRTLTTASDGASERLRVTIERKTKEKHLVRAAELARAHGMKGLKLYEMVGLPTETDEDIDELVRFSTELSKVIPLALGVAPFVAKRNTPLDGAGYAGIREVEDKLERLRKGLRGKVDVRPTSARWAWVEYVLAQGGIEAGRRALIAHQAGGTFAAWKKAFAEDGSKRSQLRVVQ
ncbi:MAG: radical protein [Myxococcales bacterium]|nr:radical protein [Myxococcales bacterium]